MGYYLPVTGEAPDEVIVEKALELGSKPAVCMTGLMNLEEGRAARVQIKRICPLDNQGCHTFR
jgi:hypothetical protein